jgi:hypothetical protein
MRLLLNRCAKVLTCMNRTVSFCSQSYLARCAIPLYSSSNRRTCTPAHYPFFALLCSFAMTITPALTVLIGSIRSCGRGQHKFDTSRAGASV